MRPESSRTQSSGECLTTSIPQQLSNILGPEAVLPTEGYLVDGVVPQAVVRPIDRQGVAQVLRWASKEGVALFPRGGGVLSGLGNVPSQVDVVLDLTCLNRVVDYQPADLTVTAEAGITLDNLRRELVQGGKFVPMEAPLPRRATVGGILATGFSGPMRYSYGLLRDWLIGISVIGADGVETKAGGRVVKNVTGYDLNKLYSGSLGTLGVIVEASFKIAPAPDTRAGVVAFFPSIDVAVAAARSLVSQVYAPQGIQVVNGEVVGRLGLEAPASSEAMVSAFLEGRPRAVGRRLEESTALFGVCGAITVANLDEQTSAGLLAGLTDLPWNDADPPLLGLRSNLPPSNVGELLEAIGDRDGLGIVADPGFGTVQILQWKGGLSGAPEPEGIIALIERVRRVALDLGGTVVVEACPPDVKSRLDVWEGSAGTGEQEIMRRIKHNLDPAGILNPGRFIGRL